MGLGQVLTPADCPPPSKFWKKTKVNGDCLDYAGNFRADGYGRYGKKQLRVHRIAYVLSYGPLKEENVVKRLCNRLQCIRPEHLYLENP